MTKKPIHYSQTQKGICHSEDEHDWYPRAGVPEHMRQFNFELCKRCGKERSDVVDVPKYLEELASAR